MTPLPDVDIGDPSEIRVNAAVCQFCVQLNFRCNVSVDTSSPVMATVSSYSPRSENISGIRGMCLHVRSFVAIRISLLALTANTSRNSGTLLRMVFESASGASA